MDAARQIRLAVLLVLALAAGCAPARAARAAARGRWPGRAGRARIVSATDAVRPDASTWCSTRRRWVRACRSGCCCPTGYGAEPDRRWPVLYLLHGCCDGYRAWTRSTDVEQLTAGIRRPGRDAGRRHRRLLLGLARAGPRWETFHLVELWQLLREDYRADDRAAVAGLSMGGLGALAYAARHPGMFTAAASFSGVAHTRLDAQEPQHYRDLVRDQGEDPQALWGDPVADADTWAAHNPFDLAPRLAGTRLYLPSGTAGRARWIRRAPRPTTGRPRSAGRTPRWPPSCVASGSPPRSTSTARAPTAGRTGSASCTAPGRC